MIGHLREYPPPGGGRGGMGKTDLPAKKQSGESKEKGDRPGID